jgi:serine/threonine-protein kinase SRPK3
MVGLPNSRPKYSNELVLGKWKGPVPLPSEKNLQSRVKNLGGDDKDDFLDLLSGFLCWLPEERVTAGQAYYHCWLRGRSDEPISIPTIES